MRAVAILMMSAGAATAAPIAHLEQDVDGDGKVDTVVVDGTSLTINTTVLPLRAPANRAKLVAATSAGVPMIAVALDNTTIVFEFRGAWREVLRGPTGPVPPDGDYSVAIAPGPNGIYRYQERAGFRRCDGKPAYLFAEGWHDNKFQRLSMLPVEISDTATVIFAKPDGTPASAPLLYQARVASYEPGAQNVLDLALPVELEDGKPATYWHEELKTSMAEGQFFTFEPRTDHAKATQLRFVAAAAKGFDRLERVAVVGGNKAWHVALADNDGAQTVDLPEPIEGCVTVIIEAAHGHGSLAIGEMSVYGDGERNGGGEAMLAKVIADGGDIKSATQALARRGAAAVTALDGELQKAASAGARTRIVHALAEIHDPSAGPVLAHAIAQSHVEERDLDDVLAALGTLGFAQELHDLVTKHEVPQAHRAAAVTALATSLATAVQYEPALLIDLAGDGSREERRAVIDGLAHAPVPALVTAARAATTPEASGDLYRAVTRSAHNRPADAPPALAAFVAALTTATDYERRYRVVDGIAALGDAPALDALAKLLQSLPAGSVRWAFDQVAASTIAKAPRPEALDLLIALVKEPDAGVRYAALTALGSSTGDTAGPWHHASHGDGVDRVIQTALASDTWPEVRARAAEMLGARCSRPGPAKALDDSVHRDPELVVRSDALAALVECRASFAAELLWKTWENKKQPIELRTRAIDLSVELADPSLAAKLVTRFEQWRGASLESTEALALCQNAAYAIGRLAPMGAGDALVRALDDGAFPEIVAAAATGLGLMGPQCPAAAKTKLRALARSEEQQVALAAAHAAALCGK
jgi:hypothetical protein